MASFMLTSPSSCRKGGPSERDGDWLLTSGAIDSGVGFKWNWRRCCIWFALLQMAINDRDASACASTSAARSAPPPHPRGAGFLRVPTPVSLPPADSRARRLGFFAGLLASVGSPPKNDSFSHSLATNRKISSSDGSAPKTIRATPYPPSSTRSANPTQN